MLDELAIAQKRIADLETFINTCVTTKRLRDEFAMAALSAFAGEYSHEDTAEYCYAAADAMMAERGKRK